MLHEQIALFSGRRTIVGSRGFAFHTALFAPPGSRSTLVPIGWDRIDGHYLLIDGIKEHESIYINSAELTAQTQDARTNVTLDVERTLDLMGDTGLL